ncbi:MAG: HAD family hydrolase [Clostridiales bacterium]|nr:HAD family hydrolase [Clostridiales bacterium]
MYEYVFFDLDGTLVDSSEGITKSVEYALNKYGIIPASLSELTVFIGPPLVDSFMRFYGFDEAKAVEACRFYRERYRVKGVYENRVYGGIPELLAILKERGKKIVLATSKPEIFANIVLEDMGLKPYFDFVAGADLDDADREGKNYRTNKEDVIAYAVDSLGIADKKTVLMVGDRKHDITGAKLNGIDSCGVLFGFGSREEFIKAGADYIVETPAEIADIILD